MKKFLLALQFWEGDKAQGLELARLIADLQTGHSDEADFLFSCRFDCTHEAEMVHHVSRKFNVWTHIAKRQGTGWPLGPNALWLDTLNRVLDLPTKYEAVLFFEPDCVPMRRDWIHALRVEWKRLGKPVIGYRDRVHINGNALFSADPKFLGQFKSYVPNTQKGWDMTLAPRLLTLGAETQLIRSFWNSQSLPVELLEQQHAAGTALIHGCKDYSGLEYARSKLF